MLLADEGKRVCIADLDIVNPYFRTKDSEAELVEKGITLICSQYANSNVDLPAIPAESYRLVQDKTCFGVIDIGGDDRGAYALGRFADAIKAEGDYRMAFVLNKFRPLTSTVDDTVEIMREIEAASGIKFNCIVNNSNIGELTTAEYVINSMDYAREVSNQSGLPIVMTTVKADLYDELKDKIDDLLPMTLQAKPI
jgi:hypothetical protein